MKEAEEVVKTIQRAKRSFPNEKTIQFFEVKDHEFINGVEYQKIIACDSGNYKLVNLPLNTSIVLLGKNSISYILQEGNRSTVLLDINEENIEETQGYPVMTLLSKY